MYSYEFPPFFFSCNSRNGQAWEAVYLLRGDHLPGPNLQTPVLLFQRAVRVLLQDVLHRYPTLLLSPTTHRRALRHNRQWRHIDVISTHKRNKPHNKNHRLVLEKKSRFRSMLCVLLFRHNELNPDCIINNQQLDNSSENLLPTNKTNVALK
jgi:hypothetical protein